MNIAVENLLNLLNGISDRLKNSILLLVLILFIIMLPPYPTFAAALFLPIKIFSVVVGVVIAIILYWASKAKDHGPIITTDIFYIILILFLVAVLVYFGVLNIVNTVNIAIVGVLLILFIFINVVFAMLLMIPIIFFPDDLFHKIERFLRKVNDNKESNKKIRVTRGKSAEPFQTILATNFRAWKGPNDLTNAGPIFEPNRPALG